MDISRVNPDLDNAQYHTVIDRLWGLVPDGTPGESVFDKVEARIAQLEAENARLREAIEDAYNEGFFDGQDHGNLSYKYPAFEEAWPKSKAAQAARKESP